MKKIITLLFLLISGLILSAQIERDKIFEDPLLNVDKIIEYKWDAEKSDWTYGNIIKYNYTYENDEIRKIIVSDFYTGTSINQFIHTYTSQKILIESLYQNWESGRWIDTRRDLWFQNEDGLTIEATIQYMINDSWVNWIRYTDYQYDNTQLQQYTYQIWLNEQWINSFYDSWYYDERGNLILREQIGINGIPINKFVYIVNKANFRQSLTIYNWIKGSWIESNRRLYEYNQCGRTNAVVFQQFKNGLWINLTKQEYFYSVNENIIPPGQRIPVCHNGYTIYISINAVDAHLKHGDCLGGCLVEMKDITDKKSALINVQESTPYTLFPNPSQEQFIISFNKENDIIINKIELFDLYGRLMKTINVNGQSEITVPRDGLKNGNYLIKIVGNEVFHTILIFE